MSLTALDCWKQQTWPEKELIILDDQDDPSFLVPPGEPGVRYYKGPKLTVGAKREWLCSKANGEAIIHFDSDDWSAPDRIAQQMEFLKTGKPMSGYHSILFWDMRHSVGYRWKGSEGFTCGAGMCYTRDFWRKQHFRDVKFGEDNEMVYAAQRSGGVATLDGCLMLTARAHSSNTSSAARIGNNAWPKVQDAAFNPAFFAAVELEMLRKEAA
jgi:hypothetical protein